MGKRGWDASKEWDIVEMQKEFITNNERAFILKALQDELRIDGRNLYDFRKVKFDFTLDDSTCTVTLGDTRVMTAVQAVLEAPYPERPNEGAIRFNVNISAMASPVIEMGSGYRNEDAMELARLVERSLKQSRAIDTEALCVLAGSKVWSLAVNTHVLDHHGNLVDACCLSALAALMAFRKPEVTVGGTNSTDIVIHPPEVKEPLPLTIHHLPISVTFGLFEDGNTVVIDPDLKEEATMQGSATIIINPNQEVCAVHKAGGVGISTNQLFRCVRLASSKAEELVSKLKEALELHEVRRVQARIRRHAAPGGAAPAPQPPPAQSTVGTDKLAAALNMLDDDEMGGSEDSEDSDEDMEEGTSGAAGTEAAAGQQQAAAPTNPKTGVSGQASLKSAAGTAKLKTQPALAAVAAKPAGSQKVKAKKHADASSKRSPEVKYDALEAIAAVIAGAGSRGAEVQEAPSLADAIKKTPKTKK